jgi:hypothetical protein
MVVGVVVVMVAVVVSVSVVKYEAVVVSVV